jgi:hypothetical protein
MNTDVNTAGSTMMIHMDRKKEKELDYLNEARRASSIFPRGEPVPNDPLDFLMPTGNGTLGIEVTELCHQGPRAEGARLGYVRPKAKQLYDKRPGAKPVFVNFAFSSDADDMGVDELAAGLAGFVIEHRDNCGSFSWHDDPLPKGYCLIAVLPPIASEVDGKWFYSRTSETELSQRELIEARIMEKNLRVPDYRKAASEVWLLIVNDLFLGPGEVCVHLEELAHWIFDFAFDKVLFFERQPGGSGKVIELTSAGPGPHVTSV